MFRANDFISKIENICNNSCCQFPTLHIALGFDNNYALPAGVTISSVIKNTPNYNLHFHLFIDNVSEENKSKFKLLSAENISITLYNLNDSFTINKDTLVLHIDSVSTCIRLIIPEILEPLTDKFVYLDSDVLCLNSLSSILDYDIDNYVAGVISDTKDMQQTISEMYNIDYKKYFNAGVLFINTKKWCELQLSEQAINLINDGKIYKFADQDVLNILLENKTLLLPIKYNTKIKISIDAHEEKSIKPYTVILHYISLNKPWFQVYLSNLYSFYLNQSPWKDDLCPLTGNSSSIRNYSKYLFKNKYYFKAISNYFLYLKYKLILKK
ncbi:hypothetical protein DKK70_05205 [Gilliamella apicola]|uniref:Glycosyl transferase family 8 C-terminal domain-containing protein n=1 Tax=Gilliamella apicola TaxID=1196095 RepID=A0A2V4E3X8_9GAMM|nr:glycosyltransferase [Gilliamella apicola]PXZ07253.1 hypothetical protein DKK70_05205 [Gilliamella apicola]